MTKAFFSIKELKSFESQNSISTFEITGRRVNENSLEIILKGGEKLEFRRFAPISRGDILYIKDRNYWIITLQTSAFFPNFFRSYLN